MEKTITTPVTFKSSTVEDFVVTQNACKVCNPLGACLALSGIKNAITLLHGSQGCATYIRRYMISHFKEPIDIASSSFSEDTAIFGGSDNLKNSIDNIRFQYNPEVIGIASTCLSETIGDDVNMIIKEYKENYKNQDMPFLFDVSTPSYKGTHADGFYETLYSVINSIISNNQYTEKKSDNTINILSGIFSPEDLRYLKELLSHFKINTILLPDYSERLDGPLWSEYKRIPEGGTPLSEIQSMCNSVATIEFGVTSHEKTGGSLLSDTYAIPNYKLPYPIGVNQTDIFIELLENISEQNLHSKYEKERGRLLDAYADGHKHVAGLTALVYGEEDFVIGLASFLAEIGIIPVICASGGNSGKFKNSLFNTLDKNFKDILSIIDIYENFDFKKIEQATRERKPDMMVGNSKGFKISKKYNIPLIRVGFPIHDRSGGQRLLHIGYEGAIRLFDTIVNTIIQQKQENSDVGYTYM